VKNKEKFFSVFLFFLFLISLSATADADAVQIAYITNQGSNNVAVINTATYIVANFSANVASNDAPLSVQFTDSSQNATGWNWDFGDGYTSTEQNPKHYYIKAGNYTVKLTAINGNSTNSKLAKIIVLQHPVYAYITNYNSGTVSIIDTATKNVIDTVSVGINPYGVAVSSDESKVYVANKGNNTVSVIDTSINKVTATIPVGNQPVGVAVNTDGTKVYVTNDGDNTISVIDIATNAVIATVPVGAYPTGVAVIPDGTKAFVASGISSNSIVYVIDTATNTVIATVPVGAGCMGVAANPDGTKVYVVNTNDNTVSVIDTATNTVIATVQVGSYPCGAEVNPDGTKVYVVNAKDNTTSIIDTATNTVIATVPVGNYPTGVSVTPDGKEAYVTNGLDGTVSIINTATNKVTAKVNVGSGPLAFGQFIEQPALPVANFNSNVISGYAPLSIQFTDLSKNAYEWSWDFGDDSRISNDRNPTHNYSVAGIYTVNLKVSNEEGSVVSKTGTITVSDSSSSGSDSSGGSSGSSGSDSSGGSSGSSGSGRGAGSSPEPQSNVEAKELSHTFIRNGNSVNFEFPQNATPVVRISFDSKKTAGMTTTIVEMLINQSTLVSEPPSEEIYKFINIWVGNSGFATPDNIENAVVYFKVEKSRIRDKNIDKSSIALNRYCDSKWNQLPTSLSGEDETYLYYTAKTGGFSPFAITGKTTAIGNESQPTAVNEKQSKNNTSVFDQNTSTPANSGTASTKTPGFESVCGILSLLVVFIYKRK
jgi:PGF-pre-PGF domain-containing protein